MDIAVKDYYLHRQDDTASEDRWRVQLNKSISTKLNQQERRFGTMLDELRAEVHSIDEKLAALLVVAGVDWPPPEEYAEDNLQKAAAAIVVQARARGRAARDGERKRMSLLQAMDKVSSGATVAPPAPAPAPEPSSPSSPLGRGRRTSASPVGGGSSSVRGLKLIRVLGAFKSQNRAKYRASVAVSPENSAVRSRVSPPRVSRSRSPSPLPS